MQEVGKFDLRIHKIINSIWQREELPVMWKESIVVPTNKMGDAGPGIRAV
jgi:hypothetical protein